MLRELHIQNLAIIADAAVDFASGLNVLTGPTGAGKSLVIGAIEILLGLRAPSKLLRDGAPEGRVTGVFELSPSCRADLSTLLDMDLADDLHLARRILATARTSASVNGHPIPASTLRQVGERLIDIHGQHDQQFLLKPANQLSLLDAFANAESLRSAVAQAYSNWRSAASRRDTLRADAQRRAERIELLTFQAADIDETGPKPGELESVDARHRLLSQLDVVTTTAGAASAALSEGDDALADKLAKLAQRLADLAPADPALAPIADALRSAALSAREAAHDLLEHIESLDADAGELAALDVRMTALRRLATRYGPTLDDVLRFRASIDAELESLRNQETELAGADDTLNAAAALYEHAATRLTKSRRHAITRLVPAVTSQFAELGLERATFDVHLQPGDPSPTGSDTVEFMICTNPGQPSRPLREIASSGEMNRIMLALKSIAAVSDRCSVLVFDEVDANVGGRMGAVIGRKLRALDAAHQVLCITHLPQLAAFADHHLHVDKQITRNQTRTIVTHLTGDARIQELAEMIAGNNISETTLSQARDLLTEADAAIPKRRRRANPAA